MTDRPFYMTQGAEEEVFKSAYRQGLSILLKGPTGCGKTRFVEAMAHDLGRELITVVVLHPLADHRRRLPIERIGVSLDAAPGFCLVISYNPGYQSVLKDLKDSTRQRMVAIEMGFPPAAVEARIVAHEAGLDRPTADLLVRIGGAIRELRTAGLREVASTRVLIAAGKLISDGVPARTAILAAVTGPLTDDHALTRGLVELVDAYLGGGSA
jgi:nitric oxide reductase NorQ protein